MENKEKIYDEKISPLMKQIIEICKQEGIPMFAEFQYSPTDFCTSCLYPDIDNRHAVINMYNALSKCKTKSGVNIDLFMFNLGKNYPNESSIVLTLMGFNLSDKTAL